MSENTKANKKKIISRIVIVVLLIAVLVVGFLGVFWLFGGFSVSNSFDDTQNGWRTVGRPDDYSNGIFHCSFSDTSKTYGYNYVYYSYVDKTWWYENSSLSVNFDRNTLLDPTTYEVKNFNIYIDDVSGENLPTIISRKVMIGEQEYIIDKETSKELQFTYKNQEKNIDEIVAIDCSFYINIQITLDTDIEVIIKYQYEEDEAPRTFSFVFLMSECTA